jgi:hypothetical protein
MNRDDLHREKVLTNIHAKAFSPLFSSYCPDTPSKRFDFSEVVYRPRFKTDIPLHFGPNRTPIIEFKTPGSMDRDLSASVTNPLIFGTSHFWNGQWKSCGSQDMKHETLRNELHSVTRVLPDLI